MKHSLQRISTLAGNKTDFMPDCANAPGATCLRDDGDSNAIVSNERHLRKQNIPKISTFLGMKIERKLQLSNATAPISFSNDGNSNVTAQRERHL
jgi:hypothetical protein